MAMKYRDLLVKMKDDNKAFKLILPPLGVVPAKVKTVKEDTVALEIHVIKETGGTTKRRVFMHYTAVQIIT